MKNIIEKILALPKWYGYCVMLIYAVLATEYMTEINSFFLKQGIEVTSLFRTFMQLSYIAAILSSIAVIVVLALLFHLMALLLDGSQKFGKFLSATALTCIVPSICMLIAIILMDDINIDDSENTMSILLQSKRFQIAQYVVNGSFIPLYIIIASIIHYSYKTTWFRSCLSVIIPVISIWGVAELFSLL